MKAFSLTQAAILLVAVLCFTATLEAKATPPAEIRLDAILTAFELYGQAPNFTVNPLPGIPIAANIAAAAVNGNPLILPETFFNISVTETFMLPPVTFNLALGAVARGSYAIVGPIFQGDVFTVASASAILSIPFIAPIESDPALTNALFPYASRMIPNSNDQAQVFIDLINHFYKLTYQRAWRQIGIISTTIAYSTGMTSALTTLAAQNDIAVIAYQQFLSASQDVLLAEDSITQEIEQLQKSDARVIVAVMLPVDFQLVMKRGQPLGLFEPNRVWFCSDGCAKMDVYMDLEEFPSRGVIKDLKQSTYGLIGVQLPRPSGPQWIQFNATFYFIMGLQGLNFTLDEKYSPRVYDSVTAMALAADRLIKRGLPLNVTNVVGALRNTTFDGLSGKVAFDAAGNRIPSYDIVNAWRGLNCPSCFGLEDPENIFVPIGTWNTTEGLDFNLKSHFFDGRTIIPDLDIRKPYDYWSCHDKKKKTDETGKSVHLETPDGDDINNIDIDYYCDNFIDCQNMSDEGYDCDPSYVIMFIVVGIITGILVLIDVLLFLPFTIIFGFIVTRRRVRAASPVFLVIIVLSGVVGYCSTYAWYGKPHKVGCGWQPWLLGLSVVAMNAALFAKTFRIWRVFKSPFKVKVISNVELLILWAIQVAPAIFILFLWTLISTPDTDMQYRDGKDHWVCVTGGFTGPPGGIVFFFILVAYEGVIMLFGVFLTIVTRKVPSRYNEGKLIAISIYNVCFLAAVIIPIVFVLTNIDPFAAWIIRTLAILYAFTATLWLQFVPMMVGVICIDKLKEPPMKQVFRHSTGASSGTKSASAAASANSAASGSGTSAD